MNYNIEHFFKKEEIINLPLEARTAVFDFDGTLIHGDIEESFFCYLLKEGFILGYQWQEYISLIENGDFAAAYLNMKKSFSGISFTEIMQMIDKFLSEQITDIHFSQNGKNFNFRFPKINQDLLEIINTLKKYQFKIYIISASLEILVQETASKWFGISRKNVAGMRLQIDNNVFLTDKIIDIVTIGKGKVEALNQYFDIKNPLIAAGDSQSDIELLNSVPDYGLKILVGNSIKLIDQIKFKDNILII